jgi:hypothetical protein
MAPIPRTSWFVCLLAFALANAAPAYQTSFSNILVQSVAPDDHGNLFVCGRAWVPGAMPKNAIRIGEPTDNDNIALAKYSRTGERLFTAVIGGSYWEWPEKMVRDGAGNMVIVGQTASTNFPGLTGLQLPLTRALLFITKVDSTGTNVVFTRTINTRNTLYSTALTVDADGNIYLKSVV